MNSERIDGRRRAALKTGGGATLLALLGAAGWLRPDLAQAQAQAWNKAAFETHSMAETMQALGGGDPAQSKDIVFFQTPDIAENGAVVPVGCATTLAGVKRLALLVEKNPNTLAAAFDVSDAVEPNFNTRVKMGQTSNVFAVAFMADGRVLYAQKEVKVTLGGCGG